MWVRCVGLERASVDDLRLLRDLEGLLVPLTVLEAPALHGEVFVDGHLDAVDRLALGGHGATGLTRLELHQGESLHGSQANDRGDHAVDQAFARADGALTFCQLRRDQWRDELPALLQRRLLVLVLQVVGPGALLTADVHRHFVGDGVHLLGGESLGLSGGWQQERCQGEKDAHAWPLVVVY